MGQRERNVGIRKPDQNPSTSRGPLLGLIDQMDAQEGPEMKSMSNIGLCHSDPGHQGLKKESDGGMSHNINTVNKNIAC